MDIEHQLQHEEGHSQTSGTSFVKTCFNGVNAIAGVGILSIPYAVSEGGWLSTIFLLLVAAVCCYTGILLKRCMDADPQVRTYQDVGNIAFGTKGRITVSVFLFLELFLVAVEFLILEGDNLAKLFPHLSFGVGRHEFGGSRAFIVISALVFLPTVWLASSCSVMCLPVLYTCFVICTFSYGSTAIIGYLMYGNALKSQVTLNLPVEKLSSKIAIFITLVNPFTKYALIVTPIAAAIEDNLVSKGTTITSLLSRTMLVASTVLVALVVPSFGDMMALIGSFLSISLSVLFPCICYLKICRKSVLEVLMIAVIIVVGCWIAIEGTYSSLHKMIQKLR
ncbi:unnamed protein product [Victoria cruziana]